MREGLEEMKACVLDVLEKARASGYMRQTSIAELCEDTSHNQFLTFEALRKLEDEGKVEKEPNQNSNISNWRIK